MHLYTHRDVENYFEVVDGRNLDDTTCRRLATAYEDGKAIFLSGLRPEFDPHFFAAIDCPDVDVLKKLKSIQLLKYHEAVLNGSAPAHHPNPHRNSAADQYSHLLRHVFKEDRGKLSTFFEFSKAINDFMLSAVNRIFPVYRFTTLSYTWRLIETINENLHLDVYSQDLPDHHVRVFVNIDSVCRIWHTSHRLEWLLKHYLHELPPDFVRSTTPGRICHDLNFKVFGGYEVAGREGAPKHICFFEPGDCWMVDSRKVSHQIFYGRKAVSTEFQVEPSSMLDPRKHYLQVVERYRTQALAAAEA